MTDDKELDINDPSTQQSRNKNKWSQDREGVPEDASETTLALFGDGQFQKAMRAAIAAGLECAPIAVSTEPCTKRPIFVPLDKTILFGASSLRSS